MINLPLVIALSTLLVTSLLVWRHSVWRMTNPSGLPLPPGPRGLPLIGNILDIDPARPWLTYNVWAERYGDIVYSSILGQRFIVISSAKVAKALFEQRSSIYSDRMAATLFKLFGANFITAFLGYTDEWRLHQKLFHLTLHPKATEKYQDMYLEGVRELVVNLLDGFMDATDELEGHLTTFSAALIMAITYGYKVTSRDDPIVNRIRRLADILVTEMSLERAMLFAVFPSLLHLPSWVPGMAFKGKTASTRNLAAEVKDVPFKFVKEQMAAGTYTHSMVSDLLQNYEDTIDGELEHAIKDTAATVYLAGAETTSATLLVFILAMVLYPEVQERARAEIDAVVGRDALPGFEHRSSLPYIEAILRETMRWYPVAPLGMPHATSTSDSYDGYYIPKGSVVMLNVWGMSRPSSDPDAARFDPDRHLLPNGQLSPDVNNAPVFGLGRRACPGRFFAEGSMWAAAVTMLSTLRFSPEVDANGKYVEVKSEFIPGVAIRPKPFKCCITSISAERERDIRASRQSF
ncbi:cytochrome P450 [Leucogyrophana mollusca]|uniref:Cytochrome P450 n=1 Tax=Leucogyrophana mollusca TaxID=85980 RepID=A0ACB8BF97_9AGAM|nr:cytochrome P450 [Leucogyrophana mollusca]